MRIEDAVAEALTILAVENGSAFGREDRPERRILIGERFTEIGYAEAVAVRFESWPKTGGRKAARRASPTDRDARNRATT